MRLSQELDVIKVRLVEARCGSVTVASLFRHPAERIWARVTDLNDMGEDGLLHKIVSRSVPGRPFRIHECERCLDHVVSFSEASFEIGLCRTCFDGSSECTNCGDRFDNDELAFSDPDPWCTRCARRRGLSPCGDCGYGYDHRDEDECPECGRSNDTGLAGLHEYHGTADRQELFEDGWSRANHDMLLGVELEVQADSKYSAESFIRKMNVHFGSLLRGFEEDSSLNETNYGIEMITQAASLPRLASAFAGMPQVSGITSHDTGTCGLHVHVSRRCLGGQTHELRLHDAMNSPLMQEFLDAIARRPSSGYAMRGDRIDVYPVVGDRASAPSLDARALLLPRVSTNTRRHPEGRDMGAVAKQCIRRLMNRDAERINDLTGACDHNAVDFSHRNTVEFRLFRGTTRPETIVSTLEFVVAFVSWTRPGSNEHGSVLRPIWDPHDFVSYINLPHMSAETKHLRRYIEEQWPDGKPRVARKIKDGVIVVNKKERRKARQLGASCA